MNVKHVRYYPKFITISIPPCSVSHPMNNVLDYLAEKLFVNRGLVGYKPSNKECVEISVFDDTPALSEEYLHEIIEPGLLKYFPAGSTLSFNLEPVWFKVV